MKIIKDTRILIATTTIAFTVVLLMVQTSQLAEAVPPTGIQTTRTPSTSIMKVKPMQVAQWNKTVYSQPVCCNCEKTLHPHCEARRAPTTKQTAEGSAIEAPFHPGFNGKIWYFTLGSKAYTPILETFVNSLVSLGVAVEDIGLLCLDEDCTEYFQRHHRTVHVLTYYLDSIHGSACEANAAVSNMRCMVSMGKIQLLLQTLQRGDAAYFFDADVMFLQHPFEALMKVAENPNLPLYCQQEGKCNFGLFLAYPDDFTINLFDYMAIEFNRTQDFDQKIFQRYLHDKPPNVSWTTDCRGICSEPHNVEQLKAEQFLNLMMYPGKQLAYPYIVHATCVEGAILPLYVMQTMFGTPNAPYYQTQKTIAVADEVWTAATSRERINRSMQALVLIASKTGRAIRIQSNVTMPGVVFATGWEFRLVSAEYIWGKLGVPLVEGRYYERATKEPFLRSVRVIRNIKLDDDIIQRLNAFTSDAADELQFDIDNLLSLNESVVGSLAGPSLGYSNGSWIRPFTCQAPMTSSAQCRHICDGGKF